MKFYFDNMIHRKMNPLYACQQFYQANKCIKATHVQLAWFPSISSMPWPTKHSLHGHKVHRFVGRNMSQGMGNERIQLSLSICKALFLSVSRQQHSTFTRFMGYVARDSNAVACKHRKKGFQSQWNVLFYNTNPTTLAELRINAQVNRAIIGPDNDRSSNMRQTIISTNDGFLLIGLLWINFSEICNKLHYNYEFHDRRWIRMCCL